MRLKVGRKIGFLISAALFACDRGKLERHECECAFLTDYDDGSGVRVSLCASEARSTELAKGCAQSAAPAPIEACTCRPSGAACARETCEAKAER
jgi:hypothetical protein